MSAEDIACCLSCHMTFGSHEELFVHTCAQIKVEVVEAEDSKQLNSIVQEDFRNEIDPIKVSENDSDYSPKKKKQKKPNTKKKVTKQQKNGEKLMTKEGKKKKVQVKREKFDEDFKVLEENYFESKGQFQFDESSNLELSEEFIALILNTVDELCENIKIGDPDIQRTLEVNKNLNDAVSCYRNKLDTKKQIKTKSKHHEDYEYEEANSESDDNPDPASKKPKGKKRLGRPTKPKCDKQFEFIRNQCGSHSITAMSLMLHMNTVSIKARMSKEGIDFSKKPKHDCPGIQCEDCYFCQMKKDNENVNPSMLFPFVKYNKDQENRKAFQCTICSFNGKDRSCMFTHIASIHKNEIYAEASNNLKLEERYDCGEGTCKKMYYKAEEKKYWCKKCFRISQITKTEKPKPEKKPRGIKRQLCPECGASTTQLRTHIDRHHGEKHTCSYCGQEYGIYALTCHIKRVHEKIPCAQCGKLVGIDCMNRHISSVHTPNDQKKYQCDVCRKGFSSLQHLRDHRNLHTGEKPYKCKFCPSCFASKGNHAMHEKGHLGYKRDQSKK